MVSVFTEKLDLELKKRGWSRYRLAKEAGIAHSTIENLYQRGNEPTYKVVKKVADAMGLDPVFFYGESANGGSEADAEFDPERRRKILVQRIDYTISELYEIKAELLKTE